MADQQYSSTVVIYNILYHVPEARGSDRRLIWEIIRQAPNYAIQPLTLEEFLNRPDEWLYHFYGVPRFEAVSRTRREFFIDNPLFKLAKNDPLNTRGKKGYGKSNLMIPDLRLPSPERIMELDATMMMSDEELM